MQLFEKYGPDPARCCIEPDRFTNNPNNWLPSFIIGGGAKPTGQYFRHPTTGKMAELYDHYVYRTIFVGFHSL